MPENKDLQQQRVRYELTSEILLLINNFKSHTEPKYKKLTKDDIINVLSNIIARKHETVSLDIKFHIT